MKKKEKISLEDREVWSTYTMEMSDVYDKDRNFKKENFKFSKVRTIDLHGLSLEDANLTITNFINDSFRKNYRKIKVITGKGKRSKAVENPYVSSDLSVLKNSVPEFIKNNENISSKISNIHPANIGDGGEGAFYIVLKKFKE